MTHPQNINDEVEKTRKRWDKQIPKEYRQEPEQMPSGAIGKDGFLYLGFTRTGRKSILHRMEKRTPLFAQKALYHDEALPDLPLRDRDIDFRLCSARRSHGVIH